MDLNAGVMIYKEKEMATWKMETNGERNAEGTVLYTLSRDEVLLGKLSYTDGYTRALSDGEPADGYQEVCDGKMYCDTTIAKVREAAADMRRRLQGRG